MTSLFLKLILTFVFTKAISKKVGSTRFAWCSRVVITKQPTIKLPSTPHILQQINKPHHVAKLLCAGDEGLQPANKLQLPTFLPLAIAAATSSSNSYDVYVVTFNTRKSKFQGNIKHSDRFAEPFLRAARSYQYLFCKTKFVN